MFAERSPLRITACIVNHDTSCFAELALRSFVDSHITSRSDIDLELTVIDNHSDDDGISDLKAAAADLGVNFAPSRWPAHDARCNTHGDVLRDFVLDHRDADMFLFIDADIMFDEPDTVWTMFDELTGADDLWAVQARYHWIERHVGEGRSLDIWAGTPQDLWIGIGHTPDHAFIGRHGARCNPFCTLVRNSDVFLRVAETVGLSAAVTIAQDEEVGGFADTLGPASRALTTHGLRYELSSASVTHFAGVTHLSVETEVEPKRRECLRLLEGYRRLGHRPEPRGPWS
jgi:hypothetical protein